MGVLVVFGQPDEGLSWSSSDADDKTVSNRQSNARTTPAEIKRSKWLQR